MFAPAAIVAGLRNATEKELTRIPVGPEDLVGMCNKIVPPEPPESPAVPGPPPILANEKGACPEF